MNIASDIRKLGELGKQIKEEGFSYEHFAEACHVYWNLILKDQIEFSSQNITLVSAQELKQASERQAQEDSERVYNLLPKKIRKKLTIEEMLAIENSGLAGFIQTFQEERILLGAYNHKDDRCYVLKQLPPKQIWNGNPNEFHAVFAAHELGHRYVRHKRESLGIQGIGNPFWEEKYCRFLEYGFRGYVFGEGNTEEYIRWRREQQRQLGASLFDAHADRLATQYFIARYREVVKNKQKR